MPRDDMQPGEWNTCPADDCTAPSQVGEYDADEDAYLMACEGWPRHTVWVRTSDEVWK